MINIAKTCNRFRDCLMRVLSMRIRLAFVQQRTTVHRFVMFDNDFLVVLRLLKLPSVEPRGREVRVTKLVIAVGRGFDARFGRWNFLREYCFLRSTNPSRNLEEHRPRSTKNSVIHTKLE